jgi:uncharacterized membrane protein
MTDLVTGSRVPVRAALSHGRDRLAAMNVAVAFAIVGAAVWTIVIGAAAVWRHQQFLSHRYDLGNMVQAVWNTAHGRILVTTEGETGNEIVRLASHVDPILVLFVPAWWVHPSPEVLILAQAAILASGVYPVVRLALAHLESPLAASLLSLWYLAFPWVTWNAFNDFHPLTLTIPLLLYCIWFLDQGRLGRFWVFAALALLCGELVGLTVAGLGIWFAIRSGRRLAGLMIAVIGVAWTAICLMVLIPTFNDDRSSRYYSLFESVGGSPTGLVRVLVTDPGAVLSAVSTVADFEYVVWLLAPTALLALVSPLLLLAVLPQLGVNLLADFWATTQPMFQYVAPVLAPLIAATIFSIGRFHRRFRPVLAAAVLCAGLLCLASRPPIAGGQQYLFGPRESPARLAAMKQAIASIPSGATVTATNRLGAHLSVRRDFFDFPRRSRSDWVVVDLRDTWIAGLNASVYGYDARRFQRFVDRLGSDSDWRIVFSSERVRVYKRLNPGDYDVASVREAGT